VAHERLADEAIASGHLIFLRMGALALVCCVILTHKVLIILISGIKKLLL
jgi:hypothetical protein